MNCHFRNIYHVNDIENSPEWTEILQNFPNYVPRFDNKEDCVSFMKKFCQQGSNPSESSLMHSVTTLTDWDQIEKYLLPKIIEYNHRYDDKSVVDLEDNRFAKTEIEHYLISRLNLSIHSSLNFQCILNTLNYMFHHLRCGIFVMIRKQEVCLFAPFVNKNFRNNWGEGFKILMEESSNQNDSVQEYYAQKDEYFRQKRDNYLPEVSQWWANGNIICNQHTSLEDAQGQESESSQWWGDSFLLQIKDMIAETCRLRNVPDCEFFINKRDYPNLKFHCFSSDSDGVVNGVPVEPYGFIFDKNDSNPDEDIVLSRFRYRCYSPILSFYTSSRFADIPIPPTEDWEAATGKVYPPSFKWSKDKNGEVVVASPRDLFTHSNLAKFYCEWNKKVDTAFFRGTATGGGVLPETNQRLNLCLLSYQWKKLLKSEEVPFLDAAITGWNTRDKKIAGKSMAFIRKNELPFKGGAVNFVEIYKQCTFKYIVYVEGHCAACRYGFMMRLGSVILKVESSCVADQMWYFPMLKPFVDHVPVKKDLSDLKEKIQWCRDHDAECEQIAKNARAFYDEYLSKDGIVEYLQSVFTEIAKRKVSLAGCFDGTASLLSAYGVNSAPLSTSNLDSCRTCSKDGQICPSCACFLKNRTADGLSGKKRTLEDVPILKEEDKLTKEQRNALLRERLKTKKIKLSS